MKRTISLLMLSVGLGLIGANLFGEFHGMRSAEDIPTNKLRFANDLTLSHEQTLDGLLRLEGESELDYAERITTVIQGGVAHLNDWYSHDPDEFFQQVPFSENFLLNFMGRFSGLPQMQRYHFSDFRRSLERGIGVCGDHALILSQILNQEGIQSTILAYPRGHVVLEARDSSGQTGVFDADYGVSLLGMDRHDLSALSQLVIDKYSAKSYSQVELQALLDIYAGRFLAYDNTFGFMRKRYIFERVSYVIKWLLPAVMIVLGSLVIFYKPNSDSKK